MVFGGLTRAMWSLATGVYGMEGRGLVFAAELCRVFGSEIGCVREICQILSEYAQIYTQLRAHKI